MRRQTNSWHRDNHSSPSPPTIRTNELRSCTDGSCNRAAQNRCECGSFFCDKHLVTHKKHTALAFEVELA